MRSAAASIRVVLVAAGGIAAGCGSVPLRTGLERLEREGFRSLAGRRVGLVTNPTGVNRRLESLADVAARHRVRITALFGLEHGVRGAEPAGVQVGDAVDARIGVPVYSLYGAVRRPTPAMLAETDVLLFDVQDVGVRAYTYLSSLVEVLEAAAAAGKEVWVLDRPNPIGAEAAEGPMLEPGQESFVGSHRLPLRHGLTAGEFALFVNAERRIGAALRVVAMEGYRRDLSLAASGLVWVAPSPNIPTPLTALVYAGTVLVEGTNLSEGRGTTRPFQLIGAPWADGRRIADELSGLGLPGVLFREAYFQPTASKHAGKLCAGVEIHVADEARYEAVRTAVALIGAFRRVHPEDFRFEPRTFDRLAGTAALRQAIETGVDDGAIASSWRIGTESYLRRRAAFLLYE